MCVTFGFLYVRSVTPLYLGAEVRRCHWVSGPCAIGPATSPRPLPCTQCDSLVILYDQYNAMEHTDPNRPDSEMFTILNPAHSGLRPRLCRLSVPNRQPIETPHYLALTSRGTVPHLSQDNFTRSTTIKGVYAGLEDCKFSSLACSSPPP